MSCEILTATPSNGTLARHLAGRKHKLLTEKGFFDDFDCLSHGYIDVVKRAMRTNKAELAPA